MTRILGCLFAILIALPVSADMATYREGWDVHRTDKSYQELVDATIEAVKDSSMSVVTQAGPTGAAAARGITIPGNRVIGIFNNDFAVKILRLSTPAMIEAPMRLYVTENADGTATLSYKTPSFILAPYVVDSGSDLKLLGAQLDEIFASIVLNAVQ